LFAMPFPLPTPDPPQAGNRMLFVYNKKVMLSMPNVLESLYPGVIKISECRLRIADFEYAIGLIFQSAIRNLQSKIRIRPGHQ